MQVVGVAGERWTITVDLSNEGSLIINQLDDYIVVASDKIEDFLDAIIAERRRRL